MTVAIIIGAAALLGLIPGAIAYRKGHRFLDWWAFGAIVWPVALVAALRLNDERARCPHCRETVQVGASICPHCRSRLESAEVVPRERSGPFSHIKPL